MSNETQTKKMLNLGTCQVCGKPIMVAAWVAKRLKKMELEPTTCSRAHADLLAGVEHRDDLEESEG